MLAKREAKLGGYDEAILLDANGYVSEGSGENIFVVRKGVIHTPDLSCSILEGITRDTVITLARELGITVEECRITRDQLWLPTRCSSRAPPPRSRRCARSTTAPSATGTVGPLTKRIQPRFFEVVRGARHVASRVADARLTRARLRDSLLGASLAACAAAAAPARCRGAARPPARPVAR